MLHRQRARWIPSIEYQHQQNNSPSQLNASCHHQKYYTSHSRYSDDHENNGAENNGDSETVITNGFNNLQVRVEEYNNDEARVLVKIMQCMEQKFQFAQRYTLKKSTIKFGNRARQAARS